MFLINFDTFKFTQGFPGGVVGQESSCQYKKGIGAGALGWPRGMVWGGRWEEGSGLGTRVLPWQIHVDVWQNQYNIVKYLASN